MARRTSDLEEIRRAAYKLQRGIGDFQAAERGPVPLGRRLARRSLTMTFFRILRDAAK